MPEFRVTFGQQYRQNTNPMLAIAHPDGWVSIIAASYEDARDEATRVLSDRWAFIYGPESKHYPDTDIYSKGQLLKLVAATNKPIALLTGSSNDTNYLIALWDDGTGDLSTRDDDHATWSLVTELRAAR